MLRVPTVGEVLAFGEQQFYGLATSLIATPFEMRAQLHLSGIDYETVSELELFFNILTGAIQSGQTLDLLFEGVDFSRMRMACDQTSGNLAMLDESGSVVIDADGHNAIADGIRKFLFLEKPKHVAGNQSAKKYLIERAVQKFLRQQKKPYKPVLEDLVIALVNTAEYKYNYEQTLGLNMFQFNASVHQIPRKIHYDHLMGGIYAGTVDSKNVSQKDLNWMTLT